MEKIITIGCFNCQNSQKNRNGVLTKSDLNPIPILIDHIRMMNFDILGTQEITKPILQEIKKELQEYYAYGEYRFQDGWIANHFPIIKDYNENNNVLLKEKATETKTISLPFLKGTILESIRSFNKGVPLPRIATIVISHHEKVGTICTINTHLDYRLPSVQKKQLETLKQIIEQYSNQYPIVLMGDFNMTTSSEPFKQFIQEVKNLGSTRVPIDESTQRHSKMAIDHIFLPNHWKVVESGILSKKDPKILKITDHTGIYVKVKIPKKRQIKK